MPEQLVELTSKEIRRRAFLELVRRARSDCNAGLLSGTTLRVLRDPRATGLFDQYLAGGALKVFLDSDMIDRFTRRINDRLLNEHMLGYFIRHRASNTIIQSLFPGVSRTRINRMRSQMDAPPPAKASRIDDIEITPLHEAWANLVHMDNDRERYIEIHRRFPHHSITTLFAALNVPAIAIRQEGGHDA